MRKIIFSLLLAIACNGIDRPNNVEINIVDGVWKHSHNDYMADRPIYDALKAGCQILEYDVIYGHGEIYVTHDDEWYDSPLTYYGPLTNYLDEIQYIIEEYEIELYVYIEVKDPDGIIESLLDLFSQYDIIFLPDCWISDMDFGDYTTYREFSQDKDIEDIDV